MSTKFTPGPWLLTEGGTVFALDETGGVNRFSAQIQDGYSYYGRTHKDRISDEEAHATGQLIAAAPDLYEALEAAEADLTGKYTAICGGDADSAARFADRDPVIAQIRAALAKARGEA